MYIHQDGSEGSITGRAKALGEESERRRREKPLRGSGGMLPRKILKFRVPEMPLPAFWGEILENSEFHLPISVSFFCNHWNKVV